MTQPAGVVPDFRRQDYYRLLQVDPIAHPEVIRAAYRTLLRVLGKHPDLGGSADEAQTIIEAYSTLSQPERRRAYDQWLAVHSAPVRPVPARPPDPTRWIRGLLPGHRLAPAAPFARSFDLVLESPGPLASRLYVKTFSLVTRANWPTIFVLCKAVAVARRGFLPSTDVVLIVAREVQGLAPFLAESRRHTARWAWNRSDIAVCTLAPPALHTGGGRLLPAVLRRLQAALERQGEAVLAETSA